MTVTVMIITKKNNYLNINLFIVTVVIFFFLYQWAEYKGI